MSKMMAAWAAIILSVFWLPASAQTAEDFAALRAEIDRLSARLAQLEQTAAPAPVEPISVVDMPGPVSERIKLKGDLHYRHNTIDEGGREQRTRHQIRARLGVTGEVSDAVEVGFQLASGGPETLVGSTPKSTNQTLTSGLSTKPIGIDLAYFDWTATDNLHVLGGKFKNPVFRPGGHFLIWDGDLNPEGLALTYSGEGVFANLNTWWLQERSQADDSMMVGGQIGYKTNIGNDLALTVGVGYFDYLEIQGQQPFFFPDGRGNTTDESGGYANDFNEVELFAELGLDVGGEPLKIFADIVENTEAENFGSGWALGLRYRRASAPGTWDVGYVYQDLEADAVVGSFTDSDFAGGTTDGKGHVLRGTYAFAERFSIAGTLFLLDRGANAGNERDYNRLHVDLMFKY